VRSSIIKTKHFHHLAILYNLLFFAFLPGTMFKSLIRSVIISGIVIIGFYLLNLKAAG